MGVGEFVVNATDPDFCPLETGYSFEDRMGCPDMDGDGGLHRVEIGPGNLTMQMPSTTIRLNMQIETVMALVTMHQAPIQTISQTIQPNGGIPMATDMATTIVMAIGKLTILQKMKLNGRIMTAMALVTMPVEMKPTPAFHDPVHRCMIDMVARMPMAMDIQILI